MKEADDLLKAIDKYFQDVTEGQLDEDFRKADWEFYSQVQVPLLDVKETSEKRVTLVEDTDNISYVVMSGITIMSKVTFQPLVTATVRYASGQTIVNTPVVSTSLQGTNVLVSAKREQRPRECAVEDSEKMEVCYAA